MTKHVCIIGAGPSGLPAIKNLIEGGISVVAYDYNSDVGGNWIYNENESHSSVFETTHIISSKTLSQYEDFPFSPEVSDYPSHEELRSYFQSYAKYFSLYQHIEFNTLVESCVRQDNGLWEVTTLKDENKQVQTFTDLVVCNGHHWEPKYPNYPGKFSGSFLHSHQYKKAAPFADKKVLVIGGGNSACDVAVESSRVSSKTALSWRRGYRIIPKFLMGKPTDVFATKMSFMPIFLRNLVAGLIANINNGSNKIYGLPKPDHKFGATHPTINSELLYKIRHGKIKPKVEIDRFDGKKVFFKDNTNEEFDVIIALKNLMFMDCQIHFTKLFL